MLKKVVKVALIALVLLIGVPVVGAFTIGFMSGMSSDLPSDSEGTIQDGVFQNIPTRWTFQIPEQWQVQSEEERARQYEASKQMVQGFVEKEIRPRANQSGELALVHADGSSFHFKANPVDPAQQEGLIEKVINITKASFQNAVRESGHEVKAEVSQQMLAGRQFTASEIQIVDPQTSQIQLSNISFMHMTDEPRLVLLSANCLSKESCEQILSALGNSQFQ